MNAMNATTRRLVAKELHQHRGLMATAAAAGLAGLPVAASGEMGFNIGFLVWLTAAIALGVLLAMFGVANERKERAQRFVMSLPLTPADYVRAKLLGLLLCFLPPWAALSAGALGLVAALPGIPDGLLPFGVLLCAYLLLNFCIVLCAVLHAQSEAAMVGVIVLTNMGVTLFMMGIGRVPELGAHMLKPEPVWNGAFWLVLALELGATAIALLLPLFVAARRRDFL
ncbi:MAG: ABC transporter permease [Roseateles sp.]|uniref:ABC transporter permease n=1 Tax=Roseateles sp. TaxID=1971397 RepID=UPI0039E8291C